MFQEFYLKFIDLKPELVIKFNEQDKLIYLGSLIIRNIHSHKSYCKKTDKGTTSPLYETCSISLCEVINIPSDNMDKFDLLNSTIELNDFDAILSDLYNKDWFMHDVFVMSQSKSIKQLSTETKINRVYLADSKREAKKYLQYKLEDYI